MVQLITTDEFRVLKPISKGSKDSVNDKISELIKVSQSVDLLDVLNNFYFDLISNEDLQNDELLMNGGTFEVNGASYVHEGIKSLLSDFIYARYIYESNVNATPFGLQTKNYKDGTPVDIQMIKSLVKQIQIDADIKFRFIDMYLCAFPEKYTRYKNNNIIINGNSSGANINTYSTRYTVLGKRS